MIYERIQSGLLVATDQMHEVETVSLVVQVKTGAAHETLDNHGISHCLEHMAFKGTKTRSALKIAKDLDNIGGRSNAYTAREKTCYYVKLLKADVEKGADILADILQNSLFEEQELAREKDVILQEIAQTNDTPDDIIFDLFHQTAYPDQPFGRSILGTKESVGSFTSGQIERYVQNNYYASNIVLAAAGKISHEELCTLAADKFGNFPLQGEKYSQETNYVGGEVRVTRDIEQVHIVLGFPASAYTGPDYYDEQVLSVLLGGGMSSRLFQEVRERRGLAYSVSAFCSNYSATGMLSVYAATSPHQANECLDVICNEALSIMSNITEEDIERAKCHIISSVFMSMESSLSRAEKLAGNLIAFGRYIDNEEIVRNINAVNRTSIGKVANQIFSQKRIPTLATIGKLDKVYNYEEVKSKFK